MNKNNQGSSEQLKHQVSYPENLLEDLLRARSLNCNLEALGYPSFLVRLYRKALHSRSVME